MKSSYKFILRIALCCLSGLLISCTSKRINIEKNYAENGITTLKRNYTGYPKKDIHQASIEVLKDNNWEIISDKNPIIAKAKGDKIWLEHNAFSKASPFPSINKKSNCNITLTVSTFDNYILVNSEGSKIDGDPIFPIRLIRGYCDNIEDAINPIFMKNILRENKK